MPDLSKEEVERRLEWFSAYHEDFTAEWYKEHKMEEEALQTALSLYARAEQAEQDRDEWKEHAALSSADAFRAEAVQVRAENSVLYNALRKHMMPCNLSFSPRHHLCNGCEQHIECYALGQALTAAAAERVKAMEAATDMLRRIARGDVSPEAGRHGAIALFKASPYFAALDAKGEE